MNKKQGIVLGVMVGVLSCVVSFMREGGFYSKDIAAPWAPVWTPVRIPWEKIIVISVLVILIGGFLIFILKNNKGGKKGRD